MVHVLKRQRPCDVPRFLLSIARRVEFHAAKVGTDRQEQPRTKCNGAQVAGLYKWQLGVPGETNVARFAGPGRSNLRPGFLVIGSVFGASRNFLVRRESGGDKKSQPKLGLSWSEEHRAD